MLNDYQLRDKYLMNYERAREMSKDDETLISERIYWHAKFKEKEEEIDKKARIKQEQRSL